MTTAPGTARRASATLLALLAEVVADALTIRRAHAAPRPKAAVAEAAAPAHREVRVRAGETPSEIAEAHGMPTASFLVLNGLRWGAVLAPGRIVLVAAAPVVPHPLRAAASLPPELVRRTVREGEHLEAIAAELGVGTEVLLRANGIATASAIYPGLALVAPARVDPRDTGEIPRLAKAVPGADAASASRMTAEGPVGVSDRAA